MGTVGAVLDIRNEGEPVAVGALGDVEDHHVGGVLGHSGVEAGGVGGVDIRFDADVGEVRLDQRRVALEGGGDEQLDLKAIGRAGLGQVLLGLLGVVLDLLIEVVEIAELIETPDGRGNLAEAVGGVIAEVLIVDGKGDRVPQVDVVGELAAAHVEHVVVNALLQVAQKLQIGIAFEGGQIGVRQGDAGVDLAVLQRDGPGRGLRHALEGDLLGGRLALLLPYPGILILHQVDIAVDQPVVHDPARGADQVALLGIRLAGLTVHDGAGGHVDVVQEVRVGVVQLNPDGVIVDHLDLLHEAGDLAHGGGVDGGGALNEGEVHVIRGEGLAIGEGHVLAEVEQVLVRRFDFPGFRELGLDLLGIPVEVKQLVVGHLIDVVVRGAGVGMNVQRADVCVQSDGDGLLVLHGLIHLGLLLDFGSVHNIAEGSCSFGFVCRLGGGCGFCGFLSASGGRKQQQRCKE